MDDIAEKRVYGEKAGKRTCYVAADVGVVAVDVSADRVGGFGVARRCSPTDVASVAGRVALATDEDVLLGDVEGFEPTGFGPAVAVGASGETPVAAGPDGRVARYDGDWTTLGTVEGVSAIDGDLVGAADGVHRLPALDHAGLSSVRDVSAVATPLVATARGLYALGNGWMAALEGDFRCVAERPDGAVAHAATDGACFERPGEGWHELDLPGVPVDVAYADATYAVTADGRILADAGDGFRSHALGVTGVVGIAVA